MGNTQFTPKEPEDRDPATKTTYSQVSSEPPESLQNGPVILQPVQTELSANSDTVDARVSVGLDNAAVSSQKTMEISSNSEASGNNLGKEAKSIPPAAKTRFAFAFSRSVPGRTEAQATNSSLGSAQLDVSSEAAQANKASSENGELLDAAATEKASDKNLSEASHSEIELSAPAKEEDAPLPKSKELTFLDRLFKLEKGRPKSRRQEQNQQEVTDSCPGVDISSEEPAGLKSISDHESQGKDLVDERNQTPLQQDIAVSNCLAPEDLAQEERKTENTNTATRTDNNIMSFFKTLVSPSKADSKCDREDKGSQTGHGGQLAEKTATDSLVKSTKKKKPDSPRIGHSTFSKLFRHKAKKDVPQTANTKPTEQPVPIVPDTKPETNVPPAQDTPVVKPTVKPPEAPVQQPAPAVVVVTNEAPKEITKERSSSTPTPLSKFFWKKTPTDDIEVINTERIEASPEVPVKDERRSQEVAETKSKGEERPTKTNLRKFFKLSVRSDTVVTPPEINGSAPDHQTLDFPDRPLTRAETRDSASKGSHKNSTDNLTKSQEIPQKTKDPQESGQEEAAETDSLQNGEDAVQQSPLKRMEKRQTLGGFFKGLSPKRMSDAGVQTDPVSIVSIVKPK
ncbi:breast carcinoma-amplified sequence 1 isoform X1 [Ahaetulla prasina]|uniref:breast carcinoma-amplified sequence 1 isoform X1 n=1 Tax=Ahaetulla prasina TaxID=499056 RepID=UPI00264A49F7|nr:breast carcinoma-amplified sequence 1 isoform X1 [Ahaetulla prasina]XP_058030462.1 breast carcinoma-amplified sequence 1 isoform X1 [Ahaetulla prasina]XP_058030466.1 breast carcinoma-amplified sequence 1 isoform X1 [Ahaetulla prasina]